MIPMLASINSAKFTRLGYFEKLTYLEMEVFIIKEEGSFLPL